MDLGLEKKTAFISGSSQGIGLSIAETFLKEGANVAISGRDARKLDSVSTVLGSNYGEDRVMTVAGDMTDEDVIRDALGQVADHFNGLDCVVANLGSGRSKSGWELERSDWQDMADVNFFSAMSLAGMAVPHLQQRDNPTITFVSSIAGCEAIPAPIPYSAAKSALQHAAKNLSRQLGPLGIRVNTVAPGNVLAPGGTWERKLAEDHEAVDTYITREVPLGRLGGPEEIADVVVFLASQRARFVTGAVWVIDGGQTHV